MNQHLMETGNSKFGERGSVILVEPDGFMTDELLCSAHAFYILRNALIHAGEQRDSRQAIDALNEALRKVR